MIFMSEPNIPFFKPVKFLDPYEKEDREYYFGREEEIKKLVEMMNKSRICILYGLSGTGKTSLIKCGVSNEFGDNEWLGIYLRRGTNINDSLKNNIAEVSNSFIKRRASIKEAIQILYLDFFQPIYLIFDQLEELFVYGSREEILEFIQTLVEITDGELNCKAVFVLREEFLAQLDIFEKYIPNIYSYRVRLERMSNKVTSNVIKSIASYCQIIFKEGDENIDQIVQGLSNKKGNIELPYLQVYLDSLFKNSYKENDQYVISKEIIKDNSFQDVLRVLLNDQIEKIGASIGDRHFVWSLLKKHFVSQEGTKKIFNLKDLEANCQVNLMQNGL